MIISDDELSFAEKEYLRVDQELLDYHFRLRQMNQIMNLYGRFLEREDIPIPEFLK